MLDGTQRAAWQPGGLELDLCAVAKGFAVDTVAELLERRAIESYLVEIGGELRGNGVKPDGMPWWVSLESPPSDQESRPADSVVALSGWAVATSGGYRNCKRAGQTLSIHLIDPRTGLALAYTAFAVSVIAPLCMHADAWATGLAVLGPEDGLTVAAQHEVAALFTVRRAGELEQVMSPAMAAMLC